ncbi:S-layer homology domain-containing protein [Paenibacillus sp. YN15]|uniref:CBM96 family carbohydrate-binding protein n=1 Tax=Paenibacillus sp. YN15 TaxID=1742774 RepID=UPI000DCC92B5|nr:S-layer homology domain-containing protein [Paenibacillus sp. YN15]RAU98169.1 hypothetical protein DQG13_17945 [Paenibacillus sp. YN15]
MQRSRLTKGLMLLFLIIFPMLGFNGAALGAVDRVNTPPEGWQLNTPPENVFKVQGSDKEFILLDAASDDDSRFLVLAKEDYGLRAYDPDSTQKFDVTDANNIAYWLNHDFIANGNGAGKQLPPGILAHINHQHVWPTEGGHAAGNCPEDYSVTAGIVVLSQTEWLQYTGKFGVKDSISYPWWLRTGRGINGAANRVLVTATDAANQGQTQVSDPKGGSSGPLVRPAFYLNKSFMTDVRLDIASLGENVKAAIRSTYTWDELRSGNAAYSASDLIAIGFTPPAGENDTQAPTWPQESSMWASEITRDSAAVTWTLAADENGVAGYKVYLNGSVVNAVYSSGIDTVHGSVYQSALTSLNPNTSYTVKVEALDPAGNITADGPEAQFRTRFSEGKLASSADTFARGGTYGSERYGTAVDLIVKTDTPDMTRETFLQFDLSGLDGEIGSATLYLYGAHTDANGTEINNTLFGVEDDNWTEESLFWNNKPGMDSYLGTLHMNKTMEWKSVDVTSFVRQQIAKDQTASFGIAQLVTPPGRATTYKSREHAVNYPYLLISKDRVNPAAPVWSMGSSVEMTDAGETEITLAWTPAVDTGEITYRIVQDGAVVGEVNDLTFTVRNLSIGTKYTFRIEALDADGNVANDGPMITAQTSNTSLAQVQLGNIFLENEPVQVKILSERSTFRWAAYNVWGQKVQEGSGALTDGMATLTVPVTDKGYYDLEVYAEAPGKADVKLETSFALLSQYDFTQIEDSFFGICTHLTSTYKGWGPHLVELINRAGAKNIRDEMHWDKVEKSKGVYTFSDDIEAYMQALKDRNMNPFIIFSFTNALYDNNSTPYSDEGRQAFANYGKAILDKYGDQIKWVEVYNEFNHTYGDRGDGPADSLPSYYYELLKKTYEVVKASHPEVAVIGPTSAGIDVPWLNELFGLGALPYMEAVSVHHYGYPISPEVHYNEKLDQLIQLIQQHNNGELTPIWLTEFGYPTHNQGTGISEKGQSNNLVKGHVIAMSKGVEKGFWYDFMNDGLDATYNENNFGIIRNEKDRKGAYVPKPAYAAYAAMTRQLTGASFVEKEDRGSAVYSYKFTRNQEELRVLWTLAPENVTIKAAGPLDITDYMGNTATYVPVNGEIYMTLSEEPIYVQGAVQDIVKGGILSLSADAPILGDPVSVQVSVQNTTDASLQVAVEVNGVAGAYTAEARQQAVKEILLPVMEETGALNIIAHVKINGKLAGRVQISTTVGKSYEIKTRPHIRNAGTGEAEILVEVVNRAKQSSLAMSGLEWSVDAGTGVIPLAEPIAPDSKYTFAIPVGTVNFWTSYPVSITSEVNGAALVIYTGQLDFSPVMKQTVDFEDGVDEAGLGIDLLTGAVQIPAGYTGPNDLSGKIGLHWDEDKLYILAKIADDTHFYSGQDSDIWRYDSIQFALSAGVPGESSQWYEYGIAQTPAGPQIYRWRAPAGVSTGDVANGELRVTRDEESKYTLYQLALPWEELTPIQPDKDSVISISFAVNDNDGAAREGYIEWGAGIAGSKDPGKFRTVELRPGTAPEPETPEEPGEEPGEPGNPGSEPGNEPGESEPVPANPGPEQTPGRTLPDSLIQLDQGKVLKAVKEDKAGSKVVFIQVPETEATAIQVQLPLEALKNLDGVAALSIVAGEISSNIPLQALTAGAMGVLLGEDAGNASLQLSIEQLAGDKEKVMKDKAARAGLTLVGNPIEFGVKAIAGVKETELPNLGAAYATRSLTLKTGTADGKTSVVWYNPKTDSFEFVPATTQRVDGSTQIITKSTQNGVFMIVSSHKSFEDVKEHWAKEEVEALASKLLVKGISDQSFNPEGRMTRAEITALLVRALTLDALPGENRFSDMKATDWFAGAAGAAAKAGLINGYEDGTFRPDGYVTREEAAVLMVRAIEITGGVLEEAGDHSLPGFTDNEAISSWATSAVSRMAHAELINGMTASAFAPQENITRAQAMAMLSRVLRYVDFID